MNDSQEEFSTQNISPQLISNIVDVIKNKSFGSVEIYIENGQVVQITERTIRKLRTQRLNGNSKQGRINRFQLKIQKF